MSTFPTSGKLSSSSAAAPAMKAQQIVPAPQIAPVSADEFIRLSQQENHAKQQAASSTTSSTAATHSTTSKQELKKRLFSAAETGNVDEIRRLKTLNVNLNAHDDLKQTAMHYAAIAGQVTAIETLHGLGAYIEPDDSYGRTPMHYAAAQGKISTIQKLATLNASIRAGDHQARTPLHEAAANNQVDAMKALIDLGANVLATDSQGRIPLYEAAVNGQLEATEFLARYQRKTLHNKASIETQDIFGNTPADEVIQLLKDETDPDIRRRLIEVNDALWMHSHPGYMRLSASDFKPPAK